jgi:hypothetical protein
MPPLHDIESLQLLSSWTTEEEFKQKPQGSRTVRFCDDISVMEIPNVPEEDRLSYWMVKEDYIKIRQQVANTVHIAVSRCETHSSDFRGLEDKTPTAVIYRRRQRRIAAINAVLQEQEFQTRTGYSDPDGIASAYREITTKSLIEAKIMGMRDEIAIKYNVILHGRQNLQDFKTKNFNDFKNIAMSFMKAERMET